MKKKVVIIGAGPAGLTAAYYLLKNSSDYDVVILEKERFVGGISKTINYNGNRMDLGGHRFFSKSKIINDMWKGILPIQGKGSYDDINLNVANKNFIHGGPDPEKNRKVFLIRNRVSRIYYGMKFFDYPVKFNLNTIKSLGFIKTISSGFSYMKSLIVKKEETNLENFYINRFGRKLYSIFFEGYTFKLWGRSPKDIDSSWGKQRVKGISITEVLKNYFCDLFKISNSKEVSLIEQFYYPKYGPGQMYEEMAKKVVKMGGKILNNYEVVNVDNSLNEIKSITCINDGKEIVIDGDIFISSMPIKDLIGGFKKVPKDVFSVADNLPYRDFITVGLILDRLKLSNETKIKTLNNIIPDTWLYIQSMDVRLGRIQVFNNWSPYLVKDIDNTVSLGLEYFCFENDDLWNSSDEELKNIAVDELIKMGIIDNDVKVLDFHVERVLKAYPAYFDSYNDFGKVRNYLDKYKNFYCIGRNGQHRYNNMDHSMLTAINCVDNILNNVTDKSNIWNVNTYDDYHEGGVSHEK